MAGSDRGGAASGKEAAERDRERPIERTAVEARQGEIILGRRGRWLWIGCGVAILLMVLILGLA